MNISGDFSRPPKITKHMNLAEYQTHCFRMSLHHFHRSDFVKGSTYHSFSKLSSVHELESLLTATGDLNLN